MKLKLFQKQDLARAALKDGLVLSWDTGLGKTWALFLWPLLKLGFHRPADGPRTVPRPQPTAAAPPILNPTPDKPERLRPNAPVLIIAPGDLHQQIAEEALTHFGIIVHRLDTQSAFATLSAKPGSKITNLTPDGRPIIPAGFYITSYTQLASNGVQSMPDPYDWDPRALLDWLALDIGPHQPTADTNLVRTRSTASPITFTDVCHFYAHRGATWGDAYDILDLHPDNTAEDLHRNYTRKLNELSEWRDAKAAANRARELQAALAILENLFPPLTRTAAGPSAAAENHFSDLTHRQQDWVIREFCAAKVREYSANNGEFGPLNPDGTPAATPQFKCVFSPSLADLSYNAFDCVVIDEGVKMKGEETIIGRGVRSMTPKYRLVLTATPIKNRLPDIFRLAWWAVGGLPEAHARFPYADDPAERAKFAATFCTAERNLTKEAEARAEGRKASSRYQKLTPEVCNVHRLWKLFGPIVLRRRKQDTGEDIVPKVRRVIRCEMGSLQRQVYQYHLDADYRDKNGAPAIGAQLQALRIAAADPSSELLRSQGLVTAPCDCLQNGKDTFHRVPYMNSSTLVSGRLPGQGDPACPKCHGKGAIPLPHRSGSNYIPKTATTLTLIQEILERKEQVIVFSAFNDPNDNLSDLLTQSGVRHVTLDGRTTQKARGAKAATFKAGRTRTAAGPSAAVPADPIPVMLAGVECMAEGHSFHRTNNVILIAYSWAADKFKQALDRVHRLNSTKPVNVYVVLCQGTIDRKLESLTDEKTDASELVLDGRLIGERTDEINLAELLNIARREFNTKDNTLDEALLQAQWPALRAKLQSAMVAWEPAPVPAPVIATAKTVPALGAPAAPSPPASSPAPIRQVTIPAWKLRLYAHARHLAGTNAAFSLLPEPVNPEASPRQSDSTAPAFSPFPGVKRSHGIRRL